MPGELEILARAHALFATTGLPGAVDAPSFRQTGLSEPSSGALSTGYYRLASAVGADLADSRAIDAEFARVIARAHLDLDEARRDTATVLAAARSDSALPDNPIAVRELLRRRAIRLRRQRAHVLTARNRAHRNRAALLSLRYPWAARRRAGADARAQTAVRAALSRLGRPYVWGATGPDRFDCSGLVKWACAQAGVQLHRTTYDQINDGYPVPLSQVRPGDLVFPHAGHVQMAIGRGLVVEAPQPGSVVQIAPMGGHVAIRRVL